MHLKARKWFVNIIIFLLSSSLQATELWHFDVFRFHKLDEISVRLYKDQEGLNGYVYTEDFFKKATFLLLDGSTVIGSKKTCYLDNDDVKENHTYVCIFKLEKDMTSMPLIGLVGDGHTVKMKPIEWQEKPFSAEDKEFYLNLKSCPESCTIGSLSIIKNMKIILNQKF